VKTRKGKFLTIAVAFVVLTSLLYFYMQDKRDIHTASNSGLSPEAYDVMYRRGTEAPFSSPLDKEFRKGKYVTADTGLPVYRSEDKYDSGTGWPSFIKPIDGSIELREDFSIFGKRMEVVSKDTGAHLGHVFDDGPLPLGKRYCMNGVALRFVPDSHETTIAPKS